jgi:hypothetical protein
VRYGLPIPIALCCFALGSLGQAGGETVLIEDVDHYRVVEPLYEAVRIVLSHRGEEYSPAYIQGISGAAFYIGGICPCAPTCGSNRLETQELPKLLGYEVEHLGLPNGGLEMAAETARVAARVKEEIRAGRAVVVWHAFTNAEWDVVCGFDEEKEEFIGRGSYTAGHEDWSRAKETRMAEALAICPAYGALLIGEKTGEFDAREAELSALEQAIRWCHAPEDPLLVSAKKHGHRAPWRYREGKACYDAWLHGFRVDPDTAPQAGDRYCLGILRTTRRAAADFMREIAPRYPEAQQQFLNSAQHFDAEADALTDLYDDVFQGWEGWKEADPDRATRAVELLTTARKAYGQAMKAVERGLEAIDPDRVARAHERAVIQRGDGRATITDFHPLKWGQGRDCTFVGALQEALRSTEHPYTYADLMGLTGLAFRIRWCNEDTKTKWCPSVAIGEMPDEQAAAAKLTGWTLPTEWLDAESRDNDALRERIVAEIDAGRPVLAYPPIWNVGLIHGYEDGGKTLLVDDYMVEEKPSRLPIEKLGGLFTYLGEHRTAPPAKKALKAALQTAVRNWQRERHHGGLEDREYWYGEGAFGAWIADLRNFDSLDDGTKKAMLGIDPWNYTVLYDSRKAAVSFLKDWGTVLDGEAREALERTAELYEREATALEPLVQEKRADAEVQDWSADSRQKQIDVLTEARDIEAKAIAELEKALGSLG